MNALTYISSHLAEPLRTAKVRKDGGKVTPDATSPKNELELRTEPLDEVLDREEPTAVAGTEEKENDLVDKGAVSSKKRFTQSRFFVTLLTVVLFVPKYFIYRPILLLWWVITLPLTIIERGIKLRIKYNREQQQQQQQQDTVTSDFNSSSSSNNNAFATGGTATSSSSPRKRSLSNRTLQAINEEDLATGDEFFLQRDTVKGSLLRATNLMRIIPSGSSKSKSSERKSDTFSDTETSVAPSNVMFGSKKMGRFLFPKKLIPKSILCSPRKKTLVIDLDETLIHSVSRGTTHVNTAQGHIVEVKFSSSGVSTLYYVYKRPYCDFFLSTVSRWYNIVIFTASMREYADPVIDWLESSFVGHISKRLYRNDCTLRDGVGYIKDLTAVLRDQQQQQQSPDLAKISQDNALRELIIVDNSPVSYAMNVDNAIQVEGWINDPTDTDLLNLLPLLEALRFTTDVRNILGLRYGEKAFEGT